MVFLRPATCHLPTLVQPNVTGTSVDGDGWSSVAHFADDTFALLLNPALHGRVNRMIHHHRSGIGGDVHVEADFRGDAQLHVAGTGANAPQVLGRAVGANVTATGLGAKSATDPAHGDVARAGADVHIALAHFFDFDIAAAGL